MPQHLFPVVYIEEVSLGSHPSEGVSTTTAGFVAVSHRGPLFGPLTSFAEFLRLAGPNSSVNLSLAIRGFFENGGQRCFVAQIAPDDPLQTGLDALSAEPISILCCPDGHTVLNAATVMAAHCENHKDRMCILHSPQPVIPSSAHHVPVHSSYAAYYYPWVTVTALDGVSTATIPPSGHLAGVYARTDTQRGVWKAPAGVPLQGITALSQAVSTTESDLLNSQGINVLRSFPAEGFLVWGARTSSPDPDWKYINIRRLLIFLEQSIDKGLQWAVFEPNGPALWATVRSTVENFLFNVWKSGALQGQTPAEAIFARCDQTTMTQSDLDAGRLILLVGVAPLRPAEFLILRITVQTKPVPKPS
jgi:phage tail sheath protein FI